MSSSRGGGKSKSDSGYRDNIWGTQGDALNELFSEAGGQWDSQKGGIEEFFKGLAGQIGGYNEDLMQGGMSGQQDMLGGGSFGDTSDVRSALMSSLGQTAGGSNMGRMYGDIVGGEGNTYIDPMVEAMKGSSMDNLDRMHSSGGLDATRAGQGGGSRHAMQNAMQSSQMNNDMLDREMGMRGDAYDTDMGWKMNIAKQADQGIQNTQQQYMNMLGGADKNLGAGMGYGQGLQNMGMGMMAPWQQAYNAPWQGLENYANIIGSPTVLGTGSSNSKGTQANSGKSLKG